MPSKIVIGYILFSGWTLWGIGFAIAILSSSVHKRNWLDDVSELALDAGSLCMIIAANMILMPMENTEALIPPMFLLGLYPSFGIMKVLMGYQASVRITRKPLQD